jgi:hypothetical protein
MSGEDGEDGEGLTSGVSGWAGALTEGWLLPSIEVILVKAAAPPPRAIVPAVTEVITNLLAAMLVRIGMETSGISRLDCSLDISRTGCGCLTACSNCSNPITNLGIPGSKFQRSCGEIEDLYT